MSQNICVVSFDHWNYDKHIVTALKKKGINGFHIKIGGFKHKNFWTRITNALNKFFLGKNPKLKRRQEFIIESLEKKGLQDQILVINPELIDKEYHLKIKKHTKKYIAYLYDSVSRYSVEHLLDGVFDEVYSFDKDDILKYNFKETTNYNYLQKYSKPISFEPEFDVLYVASFDNRMEKLQSIAEKLDQIKVSYKFVIIGKKTTLFKIIKAVTKKYNFISLRRKPIGQGELIELYKKSNVILDLVRENQSGLSFRIFEAMALKNKVITNNENIKTYNFYNPHNILVIDSHFKTFDASFFSTPYQNLPEEIYNQYTIDTWVKNIFNL